MADDKVATVVGLITDPNPQGVVSQWSARHLFKADVPRVASAGAAFITFGTMARSSALPAVAGYEPRLRHSENAEIDDRLVAGNYVAIGDLSLKVL